MTLVRIVLLFAALALPAQAQDAKKAALDLVQAELSVCMAYYTFARGCAIEKSDINSATAATAAADKLRRFAFQVGQSLGMDNDAMLARQKIAIEQQQKMLEGNCDNIVKLDEAYGLRCKTLIDNPQGVLDLYLKR